MAEETKDPQEQVQAEPKRTKIVCTLGPATEDDNVLREMILGGMNVARLNFSHGSHEYHRSNIERVRRIAGELGVRVAIMTDTKGPEIRTRDNLNDEPIVLKRGDSVIITTEDVPSEPGRIALDYKTLPHEVGPGDVIFIDDGLIGLTVKEVQGHDILCESMNGGTVKSHKGVNIPTVNVGLPSVTKQDREDIRFSCEMGVDAIAASFVRDPGAVREIRSLCVACGAPNTMVISKIESGFAVQNFDSILAVSDGIMVARGDLGIEIPPADVPHVQQEIIRKCNEAYVPVITATQMLESMTVNPRPTRAEVTDVANAIEEGSDCVMLSGETAAGAYPVAAVSTMAEICRKTEQYLIERYLFHDKPSGRQNVSGTTGYATVIAARHVGASALLCPTLSGRTARVISSFRPRLPIIATSPLEATLRRTCFYWGVQAIPSQERENLSFICAEAMKRAKEAGLVQPNDIVVIAAGDSVTSPIHANGAVTSDTPANVMLIAEVM